MALGFRPLPGPESLRTLVQANFARASLFVKCCWVEWLSWSQKPSHLTDLEGWMVRLLIVTGAEHCGDLSFGVRQCIRSVLGVEKDRLRFLALLEITLNMGCKMRTFVRYEGEEIVRPKSATYERIKDLGQEKCKSAT